MHAPNAASAYAAVSSNILEPRSIEQRVFQQTNGRLLAAKDDPGPSSAHLAEAVFINSQLWTMMAVDVLSDENTLPESLRAQIASLALYSQKAGRAVLRSEASIDELIDINRAMIAGLGGDVESDAAPVARAVQ